MATPTKTELQILDYSFNGEPFCDVESNISINTKLLDYSFLGQPFVGASVATSNVVTLDIMMLGCMF